MCARQNWLNLAGDLLIPSTLNLGVHLLMSKLLRETPEIHCACTEKSTSIPQCLYREAHMNSYGDTNTPLVDWDLQAVPDMFKATHSQF